MTVQTRSTQTRSLPAREVWIIIHGPVDASCGERVAKSVVDVLRRLRPHRIVLDIGGATEVDSAGARALLRCCADANQLGCKLDLAGVRSP